MVRSQTADPKQTTAAASSCVTDRSVGEHIRAEAAGYLVLTFHSSFVKQDVLFSCDDTGADFLMFTGILFKVMQNKVF